MKPRPPVVALLCLLIGCAYANSPMHWPSRGALVTVVNDTREPLSVVMHSTTRGGITVTHRLWPGKRITFRWAWIDNTGQLLATPHFSRVFQPWDSGRWCWRVTQPHVAAGKCQ